MNFLAACWDVAGALTFIGICTASMIDPDQMVRVA